LRDQNLRAAALAFEQALQYGPDPDLRRQYDEIRVRLTRYDENRRRGAELRRDPMHLEDALAALREAAQAWDTLQVRQEIEEVTLALHQRRDRLSVADFEVRGEIGLPLAGRTVAEELLPAFKHRYDLVERSQLGKVLDELQLQASDLADNEPGRREVGRLAQLRYLVLGSVTRLSGISVSARLVDVRTGLVVQTAKVVARTPEELLPLLPQLAQGLQLTDEQKIAYEAHLAQQAAVAPVAAFAQLPPPPEVPAPDQPLPPPVVVYNPRPPDFGGVRAEELDRLPPAPPPGRAVPVPAVVVEREEPVKQRLLHVAVELGDNLFRRGRFHEAHAQFELALNLSPGRQDLQIRLERCRPHLPPVVVIAPPPPPPPRIAVLNFIVEGDPAAVPPGLAPWAAENLAPYFSPPYEVVDRGEVFWYMGRLGLTLRDLLTDPAARRWLSRALNLRYFAFGTLRPNRGLDVTAHLVDAEYGFVQGAARIHVHDPHELKLRLAELARLTLLDPVERARYQREIETSQTLLVAAQRHCDRGEFTLALGFYEKAGKLRPGSIEIQVLFQRADRRARQVAWEEARRRELERQQELAAEFQRRQEELARQAEAARLRAEQEAAARAEAARQRHEQQAARAHDQLLVQGRLALQQGNFQLSVQLFESALGLKRTDDGFRELAQARAQAEQTARARAAEEQARRADDLRRQRDEERAQLRAQVEAERRRRADEERAQREAQEARDRAAYTQLLDQGQRLLAQEKYDAALTALQTARRLRPTDEVERLLSQALVEQARATAQAKDARARADLERRLAEEKARREQAEAEARRHRELYTQAVQAAQQALADKRYDVAVVKFQEAGNLYRTDVVLNGLRQAEEARAREQARAEAEQRKRAQEQQREADLQRALDEGRTALEARQFDQAVQAFTKAKKLAPANVDVLAGLSRAEQALQEHAAQARRRKDEEQRQAAFRKLLDSGRANLAARRYDAAVLALAEAVKLNPGDAAAQAALQEAEKARSTATAGARSQAEAKKKADEYQKWMGDGRRALAGKQYDIAIQAFREAQKVLPGDQGSAAFLKEAEKAKADAAAALAAEVQKREEEQKRAADVEKALSRGRTALQARDLAGAAREFQAAARLAPKDPAVVRAQQDLEKVQDAVRLETEGRRKRLHEAQLLVKTGREALAAKRYEDAIQAFTEASRLNPDDRTGTDLLRQAEKARADQEQERRAEQVRQLLATGQTALGARQFEAAAKALAEAARLAPKDPAVAQALQDLEKTRSAAEADADKKKRRAASQELLKAGREALVARRYDDAVKAFTEARRLLPGDQEAATLLKEAEKARADAQAAQRVAENARKKKQEDDHRAEQVKQLLASGRTALAAKQFDAAGKAFTEAAKLAPRDPAVMQALRDLEQSRGAAVAEADKQKQRAAQQALLKAGREALAARRYDDAVKAFTEAGRLVPGDPEAANGLREVEKARAQAKAAQEAEAQKRDEAQRRRLADFTRFMSQGQAAMAGRRYEEAVKAYGEALKVIPTEPGANRAYQEATQALDAAKARPPQPPPGPAPAPKPGAQAQPPAPASKPGAQAQPPANVQAEYDKQMQAGAALEKQQKLADAIRAYNEALRLVPDDPKATAALRAADLAQHLTEGQKALKARRFGVAAKEFEEALKIAPGHPEATRLLKQAREGRTP
jgi:tetratricopeptide (TPR) repeat protein